MQSVITIRKKRGRSLRKVLQRGIQEKPRLVCEEDDCYIGRYRPFKRVLHQGDKYENIIITSDHIIFKGKFLHLVQRVWQELDFNER